MQATRALEYLPEENGSERGFGVIMQAVALQMKGKTLESQKLVLQAMSTNQSKDSTYHARLLSALCFVYWMDGALKDLQQTAQKYLEIGDRIGLSETVAHAHFFLGVSSYETNDIEMAYFHLSQVVEKDKTLKLVNRHNYIHSGFALSYVYLEMGMVEKAIDTLTDSFALAEPRGCVRTYVDMGQEMATLLTNIPSEHPFSGYA